MQHLPEIPVLPVTRQTHLMFLNYCRIAWRNFAKNKVSSFINVAGLALGMAVALLNGLWIGDELSFNHYHKNYDRIGQLMAYQQRDGIKSTNSSVSWPHAAEFRSQYASSFKHIVRASWSVNDIFDAGDKKLSGLGVFMDNDAPEMLSLRMKFGSLDGLKDPYSIFLSSSLSQALFGNIDPVGKTLRINNKTNVKVTGVYEDLPLNSQFTKFKFIGPLDQWVADNEWITKRAQNDWNNHFLRVYAEIIPGTGFDQMSAAIRDIETRHRTEFKHDAFFDNKGFLFPMDRWHLYPWQRNSVNPDPAPLRMVRLVGIIGGIVLLLACINFMNLSTARSEKRAREVGIRKTIGSARSQLITQFFSESLLIVGVAWLLSLLLVQLSLPWFNQIAAKDMAIPWTNTWFWLFSLVFVVFTGLLAGSYPALYLSSFRPVKVLKGSFRIGRNAAIPRRLLVVTQFTASLGLVIATIVIYRQIQYAKARPVGYNREGLIMMQMKSPDFYGKYQLLRTQLKNSGAAMEMSESMGAVTEIGSNNNGFTWQGMNPNLPQNFGTIAITSEHGATVGWKFLEGRDFDSRLPTDSNGIILNHSAAVFMGLQHPVGMTVNWKFWSTEATRNYTVLGVIDDPLTESPYQPVRPAFYFINALNAGPNTINIRLSPGMSTSAALAKIEAVFKRIIPSAPFEYKFADEEFALKFTMEERIGKLAAFFGSLAVIISCLGLFGLATFIAARRTKEISVRKILGASIFHCWKLLSSEFVVLVMLSALLAIPLSWYLMHSWIQDYTYRTDLSWWIFAAATLGALLITLCTVSVQSIAAALRSPIHSLRNE